VIMRGRYPTDLNEYVDELDVAPELKQRLKIIFATGRRESRLFESCAALDVGETRFRQLCRQAVRGACNGITPRPPGRPSKATTLEAQRIGELERLLAEKEQQLHEALVREEVALILTRAGEKGGKKTPRPTVKLRRQKPR
jgi:hypothetical protein